MAGFKKAGWKEVEKRRLFRARSTQPHYFGVIYRRKRIKVISLAYRISKRNRTVQAATLFMNRTFYLLTMAGGGKPRLCQDIQDKIQL
jgi:hypothetical protein